MITVNQFITIFTGGNLAAPIWDEYAAYVAADNGTLEGRDCTINAIASLL
jgi:chitodextrinase